MRFQLGVAATVAEAASSSSGREGGYGDICSSSSGSTSFFARFGKHICFFSLCFLVDFARWSNRDAFNPCSCEQSLASVLALFCLWRCSLGNATYLYSARIAHVMVCIRRASCWRSQSQCSGTWGEDLQATVDVCLCCWFLSSRSATYTPHTPHLT